MNSDYYVKTKYATPKTDVKIKTVYEFISFVEIETIPSEWSCRNKRYGDQLGIVKWYPAWHQYCYFPTAQAVHSAGCLRDIQNFINKLSLSK